MTCADDVAVLSSQYSVTEGSCTVQVVTAADEADFILAHGTQVRDKLIHL